MSDDYDEAFEDVLRQESVRIQSDVAKILVWKAIRAVKWNAHIDDALPGAERTGFLEARFDPYLNLTCGAAIPPLSIPLGRIAV